MTDPLPDVNLLPSKERRVQRWRLFVHGKNDWVLHEVGGSHLRTGDRDLCLWSEASAEIERLQQELARTESARVAILAENEHYKRRVEELSIHAEKWVKRALGSAQPPGDR